MKPSLGVIMFTVFLIWAAAPVEFTAAQEGLDEASGGTQRLPCCTTFSSADSLSGNLNPPHRTSGSKAVFGTDKQVGNPVISHEQTHQSLATDKYGNFYVAWQDGYYSLQKIMISWSNDGGETWQGYAQLSHPSADLREPCITVSSGGLNNILHVAYIVDDGVNMPYPEVASSALPSKSFTFYSIPVWNWEGYAKPVIWTNAAKYSTTWRVFLTCEAIVSSASSNINVCYWRSGIRGGAFGDGTVLLGNSDPYAWRDPDGAFGTPHSRNYITCFNDTNDTLYAMHTENYMGAWQPAIAVYAMTTVPAHEVDPEIEAAVLYDNVMICCTKSYDNNDNIGVSRSSDGGETWGYLASLNGYTFKNEYAAALATHAGGESWHLVFTTSWNCWYSKAPQDMSSSFQLVPDQVDDLGKASSLNPKKAVACTWDNDVVGIAWTDYRDGSVDYDTYFDHVDDPSRIYVPGDYSTIQAAINASTNGQSIHVGMGTYYENIQFNGKAVHLIGTFGHSGTTLDGGQNDSVVKFQNGEGSDSVIEGFYITNGRAAGGGGIHCYASSPHIVDNYIRNNESWNYGGGIHCNTSGNPFIANNVIVQNSTSNIMGGGVYCRDAEPVFMNNLIVWNSSASHGGGMVCYDSDAFVLNNTICNNMASSTGGGLYVKGSITPEVRNTILWNNTAPSSAQISVDSVAPTLIHCNVEGGWPGTNNISRDPRFQSGSWMLSTQSPCINMGTDHFSPTVDIASNIRPQNGTADIGAYEFTGNEGYGPFLLAADRFTIEESAATEIHLTLDAEPGNAYRQYFILAGVSGCVPGLPLPGGNVVLPMNWDPVTDIILSMWNSPALQKFYSSLDALGTAEAVINTGGPLPPGVVGVELAFSYGLFNPPWNHCDVASNPVIITVVP